MGLETKTNGNTTYLQIDYGKKSMYIYNAEEKEGFEKHTSEKGKVTYRKYINAVTGHLTSTYFRDGNFGPELTMVFSDEDGRYSLSFGVDSSVFLNLARSINNIDITKLVRLAIYDNRGDNGKSYFGVSLSYPEVLNADGKATFVEWGEELPKGKQLRTGKWDFTAAQDEAYGRFEKFIEDNDFTSNNVTQAPSDQTAEANDNEAPKTSTTKSEVDPDDLPF